MVKTIQAATNEITVCRPYEFSYFISLLWVSVHFHFGWTRKKRENKQTDWLMLLVEHEDEFLEQITVYAMMIVKRPIDSLIDRLIGGRGQGC